VKSADFEQAGMQENASAENARKRLRTLNPLVLAVSLEVRIERSIVENRERSIVEAENALPLGLIKGSFCSRKRSRLGFADSADRDAGRRAKSSLL